MKAISMFRMANPASPGGDAQVQPESYPQFGDRTLFMYWQRRLKDAPDPMDTIDMGATAWQRNRSQASPGARKYREGDSLSVRIEFRLHPRHRFLRQTVGCNFGSV